MPREIVAKMIHHENIAPYGSLVSILEPSGFSFDGEIHRFYADRLLTECGGTMALSPLLVKRPETLLIEAMEMHHTTAEIMICLDADVLLHVAPPQPSRPDTSKAEAFIVPRGVAVKLNMGVWHLAPLPVTEKEAHILIILPQRCYADDCDVVELAEEDCFVIKV